ESADGFRALSEGDAVHVEQAYANAMSPADRASTDAEQQRIGEGISSDIPEVLLELFGFPYAFGPAFIDALIAAGGTQRVDGAFRAPPVTSEQVVEPAKYLAGEGPKDVASPAPNGREIDRGVIGEFGLFLMFERTTSQSVAVRAAR